MKVRGAEHIIVHKIFRPRPLLVKPSLFLRDQGYYDKSSQKFLNESVQSRLSIIFISSKEVGVARATLCHTLAMPLVPGVIP